MGRPQLLTVAEAARAVGVTPQALCIAMTEGRLPFETIMVPAKRIRRRDLSAYIARTEGKPGRNVIPGR